MIKNFLLKLKREGWTQEAIAEKVGVRQNQISTLMKGGDCKASTVIKIARAFNVSADEVLGIQEKEPDRPKANSLNPNLEAERGITRNQKMV